MGLSVMIETFLKKLSRFRSEKKVTHQVEKPVHSSLHSKSKINKNRIMSRFLFEKNETHRRKINTYLAANFQCTDRSMTKKIIDIMLINWKLSFFFLSVCY